MLFFTMEFTELFDVSWPNLKEKLKYPEIHEEFLFAIANYVGNVSDQDLDKLLSADYANAYSMKWVVEHVNRNIQLGLLGPSTISKYLLTKSLCKIMGDTVSQNTLVKNYTIRHIVAALVYKFWELLDTPSPTPMPRILTIGKHYIETNIENWHPSKKLKIPPNLGRHFPKADMCDSLSADFLRIHEACIQKRRKAEPTTAQKTESGPSEPKRARGAAASGRSTAVIPDLSTTTFDIDTSSLSESTLEQSAETSTNLFDKSLALAPEKFNLSVNMKQRKEVSRPLNFNKDAVQTLSLGEEEKILGQEVLHYYDTSGSAYYFSSAEEMFYKMREVFTEYLNKNQANSSTQYSPSISGPSKSTKIVKFDQENMMMSSLHSKIPSNNNNSKLNNTKNSIRLARLEAATARMRNMNLEGLPGSTLKESFALV